MAQTEKPYFEVELDGFATADDIRNKFGTFYHRRLEHFAVSELREQVYDVMEEGQDEFLQCLEFLSLGWGFAAR